MPKAKNGAKPKRSVKAERAEFRAWLASYAPKHPESAAARLFKSELAIDEATATASSSYTPPGLRHNQRGYIMPAYMSQWEIDEMHQNKVELWEDYDDEHGIQYSDEKKAVRAAAQREKKRDPGNVAAAAAMKATVAAAEEARIIGEKAKRFEPTLTRTKMAVKVAAEEATARATAKADAVKAAAKKEATRIKAAARRERLKALFPFTEAGKKKAKVKRAIKQLK